MILARYVTGKSTSWFSNKVGCMISQKIQALLWRSRWWIFAFLLSLTKPLICGLNLFWPKSCFKVSNHHFQYKMRCCRCHITVKPKSMAFYPYEKASSEQKEDNITFFQGSKRKHFFVFFVIDKIAHCGFWQKRQEMKIFFLFWRLIQNEKFQVFFWSLSLKRKKKKNLLQQVTFIVSLCFFTKFVFRFLSRRHVRWFIQRQRFRQWWRFLLNGEALSSVSFAIWDKTSEHRYQFWFLILKVSSHLRTNYFSFSSISKSELRFFQFLSASVRFAYNDRKPGGTGICELILKSFFW